MQCTEPPLHPTHPITLVPIGHSRVPRIDIDIEILVGAQPHRKIPRNCFAWFSKIGLYVGEGFLSNCREIFQVLEENMRGPTARQGTGPEGRLDATSSQSFWANKWLEGPETVGHPRQSQKTLDVWKSDTNLNLRSNGWKVPRYRNVCSFEVPGIYIYIYYIRIYHYLLFGCFQQIRTLETFLRSKNHMALVPISTL